jgi:hypothetical protein
MRLPLEGLPVALKAAPVGQVPGGQDARDASDRGDRRLKLARAFGSLGAKGLLGPLGRLLRVLSVALLVILLHPTIVFFGPLGAEGLGLSCAFGRFLGVVWSLFAHRISSFFPLLTDLSTDT